MFAVSFLGEDLGLIVWRFRLQAPAISGLGLPRISISLSLSLRLSLSLSRQKGSSTALL